MENTEDAKKERPIADLIKEKRELVSAEVKQINQQILELEKRKQELESKLRTELEGARTLIGVALDGCADKIVTVKRMTNTGIDRGTIVYRHGSVAVYRNIVIDIMNSFGGKRFRTADTYDILKKYYPGLPKTNLNGRARVHLKFLELKGVVRNTTENSRRGVPAVWELIKTNSVNLTEASDIQRERFIEEAKLANELVK